MSRLIVYAGPNGGGKSTMRDAGGDEVDVVIDPDRIARDLSPVAPQSAQIEAGRAAVRLFRDSVSAGKSVSIETTLTGRTIFQRLQEATRRGYEVELRYIALASAEIHVNRIEQRVLHGGHYIPPATVRRRYRSSLEHLPAAVELSDRVTVIDNSDVEKRTLLRAAGGAVLEIDPRPPLWFDRLLPGVLAALNRRGHR